MERGPRAATPIVARFARATGDPLLRRRAALFLVRSGDDRAIDSALATPEGVRRTCAWLLGAGPLLDAGGAGTLRSDMIDASEHLEGYVEGWRARSEARAARERERARRLREAVTALVPRLVALGARRIVLFGSLARGDGGEMGDVDLLVEGLAPERFLEASVLADRIVREARVDLVPLALARPEILARAEEEGEVLHE